MEIVIGIIAVGIMATAFLDVWIVFIQPRLLKIPFNGFHLVGRWVAYFPQRRFVHENIGKAESMPHEVVVGWMVHYLVGVLFAGILIGVAGASWLAHPAFIPAILVGMLSVVAPFCVMQPAFGLGFAAAKTPKPWTARRRSFLTHTVFGLGLYAGGLIMSAALQYL